MSHITDEPQAGGLIDKYYIKDILLGLIVIGIIIFGIALAIQKIGLYYGLAEYNITKEKCCGGMDCSDTYYLKVDDKCHSTFENIYVPKGWQILAIVIVLGFIITILFYLSHYVH